MGTSLICSCSSGILTSGYIFETFFIHIVIIEQCMAFSSFFESIRNYFMPIDMPRTRSEHNETESASFDWGHEDSFTAAEMGQISDLEKSNSPDKISAESKLDNTSKTIVNGSLFCSGENDSVHTSKRRRIHMDVQQCMNHSNTAEGASSLTQPANVQKSTKDSNRGLYPRIPNKGSKIYPKLHGRLNPPAASSSSGIPGGFQSASHLLASSSVLPSPNPQSPQEDKTSVSASKDNTNDGYSQLKPRSKPKLPMQSNTLKDYPFFHVTKQITTVSDNPHPKTPTKTPPKITMMHSPIKQVSDSIYIDDGENPSCSQGASQTQKEHKSFKELFKPENASKKFKRNSKYSKQTPYKNSNHETNSNAVTEPKPDCPETKPAIEDKYGLLGTGQYPEDTTNHFLSLPVEVLENIFCQMPMLDLCLHLNIVCKQWNAIISNENFVPWKKKYHMLKKRRPQKELEIRTIMSENGMATRDSFLLGLVKYMKGFKLVTRFNTNKDRCLQKHPKYSWALALMKERINDVITNDVPNPWCMIALLVVLSENVQDCQEIIKCLLSKDSQCSLMELLDCLYCILAFLYTFKAVQYNEPWTGMHYRLYYALYLFENTSCSKYGQLANALSSKSGQQSILKYGNMESSVRLTHEQMRICNHNVARGEIIKIVAFAGTGKTTTLIKYTQLRPSEKYLLVVYNKSVREHAKSRFPSNVNCMTGHALAYKYVGYKYRAAGKFIGNLKVYPITQILPQRKGDNLYSRAKFVKDTLETFMASADDFITTQHVPEYEVTDKNERKAIPQDARMRYSEDAEYIWERIKDKKDKGICIPFDGFLKLYQLSKPRIWDCDCILIDEAQDLTPAITDIMLRQSQAKILVGDPHQQIYSFRGAVNAMERVQASHIFYLTQSFRFGPEVAFAASCILEHLKGEKTKTLVGNGIPGSVLGESNGQIAIVTRTNFQLFQEAVGLCSYTENIRIAFVGGLEGFGFDIIDDIYTLTLSPEERIKENKKIHSKFIGGFQSLDALEKYATKVTDHELKGKIQIVKVYRHSLPMHISKIRKKATSIIEVADYVLTTAHKSKGLEFNTVRLTDDFSIVPHGLGEQDENNLLYVAATRAKKCLQMNRSLHLVLKRSGENFQYPMCTEAYKEMKKPPGNVLNCFVTGTDFEPQALVLVRKSVKLMNDVEMSGGPISPQCISEEYPSLRQLIGHPNTAPSNEDDAYGN
ncbi:unnamed protein product [Owenia fusiformis]|uniref:DNA 3'-5' helicase n=1 Tax=Owenia fusiformis TaxID=6347 RepID=A0A8S4NLK6_OWEFU|nr:unnamed protein product [Owenia fusiformis]